MALRDLKLTFRLDDKVSSKLGMLGRRLGGLNSPLAKLGTGFRVLGRVMLGVAGAALAVGAAVATALKKTVDRFDEIGDTAARLQVSTDALQEMAFAADQADISFAGLVSGLRIFSSRRMKLGLTGDPQNDLLTASKAFEKLKTTAARSKFAEGLFGRGGMTFIPLLEMGPKRLAELFEEAHRRGVILSKEQIEAADQADKNIKNLRRTVSAFVGGIAGQLLPTIADLTGRLDTWLKSEEGLAKMAEISQAIASAAVAMGEAIPKIASALSNIGSNPVFQAAAWLWQSAANVGNIGPNLRQTSAMHTQLTQGRLAPPGPPLMSLANPQSQGMSMVRPLEGRIVLEVRSDGKVGLVHGDLGSVDLELRGMSMATP